MSVLRVYSLSIISGVLSALSQPLVISIFSYKELLNPFYAGFIAWVSFVPILYVLRDLRPKAAFISGLVGGIFYFGIVLYWLDIAMTVFGNMPQYLAIPVLFLLVVYCALYWGIWSYLSTYIHNNAGIDLAIIAPIIFVCLEYLRNYLLSGFPWGNIAYSQYKNLTFIQISAIGGIYIVQYIIFTINSVIARWIRCFISRKEKRPVVHSLFLLGLLIFVYIYGLIRADGINAKAFASDRLKVSLLQGNIDQGIKKRSTQYRGSILSNYLDLLERAKEYKPELVVWPEAAYPMTLPDDLKSFSKGERLLKQESYPFVQIIGVSTYFYENERRYLHNGAFLVDQELNVIGRYYKSHLVPFGEYVPLGIPVEKFVNGIGTFVPGKEVTPIKYLYNQKSIKAGLLICYEGIFPEISREHTKKGANILVNLTNDAWYGISSAPYQHLSMYVFRAIENGKYLIRVANTGVTAIINPYGKIEAETEIFERDVLNGEVALIDGKTIYTYTGDLFAIICTILTAITFIIARSITIRKIER